ncbi:MAG: hypothetical protein DRJ61_06245 [Acidobacteria bacterium]|nr:MAG: hypothetical protein DRJ61_06245 [Acidobacteriota bacterium]
MTSGSTRIRTVAIATLVVAGLVGWGLSWYVLFRPLKGESSIGEKITIRRKWGNAFRVEIDRNSDGKIDYRSIPDPKRPLAVSPLEFWTDNDFDGGMELHIVLGHDAERPARLFEFDTDGDGIPEVILKGDDADAAYGEWLRKHEADPIQGPQPRP